MEKHYLNEREVSQCYGWPLSTLRNWRHLGKGPVYCKVGKAIRYPVTAVENFMESHRINRGRDGD